MYFFLYPRCKLINKEMFPNLQQPACFRSSHNTMSVYLYSVSCPLLSLLTDLFPRQLLFSMQPQSLKCIMNFPSTIVSVFAAALEGLIFSPLADFPLIFQAPSHIILLQLHSSIICQTTCSFFSELLCTDSVLWFCTCLSASTFFPLYSTSQRFSI